MPEKIVNEIIKELNHKFKENFQDFKGSYLYGSMVKGNYYKDSDIDIVAIFDNVNWNKTFEISGIICDLMNKYDVYIDLHPYTPDELKRNPVYYDEVVNKGQFYDAA